MKKNLRYGLIAVLILALLVVTGLMASAAGEVQLLDETEAPKGAYDTLEAAAAAAEDGDIINITADLTGVTAVEFATPDEGVTEPIITIKGNGHTVTFAAGGGLVVGECATLYVENVTLTTADFHATAILIDEDGYELGLNNVIISGFGIGIDVNSVADVTIEGENTSIITENYCIKLRNTSVGGSLTIEDGYFEPRHYKRDGEGAIILDGESNPTLDDTVPAEANILCNGADVVINGGEFVAPTNYGGKQTGLFYWNDGAVGSHLTITDGYFHRRSSWGTILFMLRGDGTTLPNFGDDAWVTISGGTFECLNNNNPMFGGITNPVKGDTEGETYADIVISGGTFKADASGNEAMFDLYGVQRLTITGGTFTCYRMQMLFRPVTERKEEGKTETIIEHNILGGTFVANSLLQLRSETGITEKVAFNFGAPGTEGPTVTLCWNRMNNQDSRGAIFLQNYSGKYCSVNFYSGTFTMLDQAPLDKNGEATSGYTNKNFIHGAGATVNIYGGTFNYQMDGLFMRDGDGDQFSVLNVLKNDGETGPVFNLGNKSIFFEQGGGCDHNDYELAAGHLIADEEHGDKVLHKIYAGTFNGGERYATFSGPGWIITIGDPETGEGPTFQNITYFGGFFHFSNNCSVPVSDSKGNSKTPGTLNVYAGTFDMTGEVKALFNCHGGKLNVYGGNFTVATGTIFNFQDQDRMCQLTIEGGTFTLTGTGSIINMAANNNVGNIYKGYMNLVGGTFRATGDATGALFSLTGNNMQDDPINNVGDGSFTLGDDVVVEKVATARYFNLGPNRRFDVEVGERVFPQDPTKTLGGYRATAVSGGYKVVLTDENKVFAGGQMNLTNEYQLKIYWKVTEAEAAAYTKTTMTGISVGFAGANDITEKTVLDVYPDSTPVEAGYKLIEVTLPKATIQQIGAYFTLDLYVSDSLLASIEYSAVEYLRTLSYKMDVVKAEKQAALLAANPEADANALAAEVVNEVNTQKLVANLAYLGGMARQYATQDERNLDENKAAGREIGYYTPYNVQWYHDKSGFNTYRIGYSALAEAKAAQWTYTANVNANLTGVGARFDTALQLYVKFTAADLTGITVTYTVGGGEPQEARIVDMGDGNYVAYTQFTDVLSMGSDVVFTLAGDTNTQTCTYSYAAFITSYVGSDNSDLKELAKAVKQFMDAVALYTA